MQSKIPKVSVCMITYNHEEFIAEAIEGVLMQEVDFEVELLIADDASIDKTGEIVNSFIQNHPKGSWIKYIRHSKNLGMIPNFIWALNQCKATFIAFCEGDDYWMDSKKLEMQYEFLNKNRNFVISFHEAEYVNSLGKKLGKRFFNLKNDATYNSYDILSGQLVPLFSSMFRNDDFINNIPDEFKDLKTGDIFLYSYLSQFGLIYYQSNIKPTHYRVHQNGTWSSMSLLDQKLEILKTLKVLRKYFRGGERKVLQKKICDYLYEISKILKSQNKKNSTYYFLLTSLNCLKIFYWKILFYSIIKMFVK